MELKVGDVFFTHSQSKLGRLIRWAETDRWEKVVAWSNHVGIVVESGASRDYPAATVVEALWKTRKGPLQPGKDVKVRVFRHRAALSARDKRLFTLKAQTYVGDTYGWWKLGVQLSDRVLFGGKKVFSNLMFMDNRPICSYLAAQCFDMIGIRFGMDPDAADPDSMMRWCEKHSADWEFVGEEVF
jgi:hypothetical protein